jgi:hypothetical protein
MVVATQRRILCFEGGLTCAGAAAAAHSTGQFRGIPGKSRRRCVNGADRFRDAFIRPFHRRTTGSWDLEISRVEPLVSLEKHFAAWGRASGVFIRRRTAVLPTRRAMRPSPEL